MELKVNLPDTLANEAQAAGLLTSQAIERLLREAVRSKAVNELFVTADRLAAAKYSANDDGGDSSRGGRGT